MTIKENMKTDTIFALSSAKGRAGVAVFRISGPKSLEVLRKVANYKSDISPRLLYRAKIIDPDSMELIDDAMFVYFKAPNSFTGEEVVEIHTHGSIAITNILTEILLKFEGARYAEAGEFTRRAVLNDKMDLTKAEGLIDLINSETLMQHKQSIKQMDGFLYKKCEDWRKEIISVMSLVEAFIDFPDEEIPEQVLEDAENKINSLKTSFQRYLNDKRRGERLRNGIKLTIYGKPNVGKSSLLNCLTKREVAIVSEISGTTRDIIETHLDIGGYPIILTDTAGIHEETQDTIEKEGIRRARIAVEEADIKIYMQDASSNLIDSELDDDSTIYLVNKIDLANHKLPKGYLGVSIKENIGLDALFEEIAKKAAEIAGNAEDVCITQTRHRVALQNSFDALERFDFRGDIVIAAEELRIAAFEISMLIGRIDVEDILDQIFSSFCIGK